MRTHSVPFASILIVLCGFSPTAFADGQDEPIPSFYEEPGISRTRDYTDQHAHEHIDPFTGKLQWHFVDLFIPGNGGLDLKVQRSYSTPYLPDFTTPPWEPTLSGLGWTMHFGRVIRNATTLICDNVNGPKVNPVLELPDGSRRILYVALDGLTWISTDLWQARCDLATSASGLDVFSPDGTRYDMTTIGPQIGTALHPQNTFYVTKITDRNGNWMSFSYTLVNGLMAVSGVTTSDGRTLTFNYLNNVLDNVTDGTRTWKYVYGPGPAVGYLYLKQVIRPDGNSWTYEYNEASTGNAGDFALRKVTYPHGGTIEYSYGFVFFSQNVSIPRSTVVTQKVAKPDGMPASPGQTWTWSYTPATTPMPLNPDGSFTFQVPPTPAQAAGADATAVSGPDENRTYYHFGYNSASPGYVYLIGTSLGNSSPVQNEAYYFVPTQISNQPNQRPGDTLTSDGVTAAPLATFHGIGRAGESFSTNFANFDGFGNAQTITETGTDTRTTNVIYYVDTAKWIIHLKKDETVTDGNAEQAQILATTRTFDPNANLLSETRAGVTTSYTYTAEGDLASRTDARQNTTSYSSYLRGIPQLETQPEAVTVTRVVSNAGNVTSETDGEGATKGFSYDGLNRITGITHPLGNPVTVDWTATTRTVTRGAYREVVTYDGFGRQLSVQHTDTARAESIVQSYQVDSLGRRVFASYPNAALGEKFTYDMLNRPGFVFHEFNPANGAFTTYRQTVYQSYGIQTLNERGFTYTFGYRMFGDPDKRDLVSIVDPLSNVANTTMKRNVAGQMTSVTMDGVTRSYGYDTRFFLTSITDPETGITAMGRDEVGNMSSRQVGTSGVTGYTYDGRNRQTAITYPAGTPSVTLGYYKDDKLKFSDNGVARCDYVYDANKNLTSETLTVGTRTFPAQYTYDGNDALATLVYGSGRTVTYAPDAFGRPRQVAPYVSSVGYHPTGQPSNFTFANGVQTTVGLNGRQWPSTLQVGGLFNSTYLYDGVGNVTSIGDSVDGAYNRGMSYDPLDRVTGVSGPWGSATLAYDFRGNITGQSFGAFNLTYTYDAATQRLASVTGSKPYTFSYDLYGNVTNNGTTAFGYNDAPNLRCANCGLANEILYDYDGKNQRVHQLKAGVDTYFVYGNGGQLLWEETPNSSLKEYVYLGGKQVAVRQQALP
jgi:YD repeat-containing protein